MHYWLLTSLVGFLSTSLMPPPALTPSLRVVMMHMNRVSQLDSMNTGHSFLLKEQSSSMEEEEEEEEEEGGEEEEGEAGGGAPGVGVRQRIIAV